MVKDKVSTGDQGSGIGPASRVWDQELGFSVRAVGCVDTGIRQAEEFDRTAADEVLGDDLADVVEVDEAVPDGLRIDDHDGAVLALVEAAGLVDADAVLEAGFLGGILQGGAELFAVLVAAAGAVGGVVALVEADEDVAFKIGHWGFDAGSERTMPLVLRE